MAERVYRSRDEAKAHNCFVATTCYPWTAYSNARPPVAKGVVRTDLEANLARALLDITIAAEGAGWDVDKDNAPILNAARDAIAEFMGDANHAAAA